MNCPTDGVLRTLLDGEVSGGEFDTADQHIQNCEDCLTRLGSIQAQATRVRADLEALEERATATGSKIAYERYRQAHDGRASSRVAWLSRFDTLRPRLVLGWLAVAFVVLIVLGFSPGRTWAQKILEMLRVQKIAVVPVDLSAFTAQSGNGRGHLIAQFISDNVVVTMKPGAPTTAGDAVAAGRMAGFQVRTLDQLGVPMKILVNDEGAFQMTLNRDRMQALLEQAARSDVQIPDSVDGSLVAVRIPKMVLQQFGNCGQPAKTASSSAASENCINFAQVPSPTISVPPSLNIGALAEAGLQVAGMSAAEAHAFAQTVDWSSTLVIPIPQAGGSYRTVEVDGVNGTLIETLPQGKFIGHYDLIWVKNGVVYSLGGQGSSDRALAAAESLS